MLLSLRDVALFDEEVVDFSGLVDVDLDQRPGLGQPQPALPPALVHQGLFVLQVGPRNQPHHLAELRQNQQGLVRNTEQLAPCTLASHYETVHVTNSVTVALMDP